MRRFVGFWRPQVASVGPRLQAHQVACRSTPKLESFGIAHLVVLRYIIDRVFRAQSAEKNEWAVIRVKLSDYDRNIDG